MGPASDPRAVGGKSGTVREAAGLGVVDPSSMPECIRANTNVTRMMMGARVSDFIREGL